MRLALEDPPGSGPVPGGFPGALTSAAAPPGSSHSSDPRSNCSYPAQCPPHPRPAPAPCAPHVALGPDPWASPGGGAGLTSQSEPLRSAVPPNQRLRGYLAPPTLLLVALPPRSCPDSLSSRPRHSSAPRGRPSYSTRSARSLNDHAVPPLHPQMAEDLVPRIPLLGGY